jgi:hypothetical protein
MKITNATSDAVKYSCLHFHYAKCVPQYSYAYNIYNDDDQWCGCILFGLGANNNMAESLECISGTCLELQRVALNGKQGHNATSKAISMAMRKVKQDAVYLKCLFSYADTNQNHVGIIYQATNWIYIGESKSYDYEKDGVHFHGRTVSDIRSHTGKTRAELGFKYVRLPNKHIYIYPYDNKVRRNILKKQKTYPKLENKNE